MVFRSVTSSTVSAGGDGEWSLLIQFVLRFFDPLQHYLAFSAIRAGTNTVDFPSKTNMYPVITACGVRGFGMHDANSQSPPGESRVLFAPGEGLMLVFEIHRKRN